MRKRLLNLLSVLGVSAMLVSGLSPIAVLASEENSATVKEDKNTFVAKDELSDYEMSLINNYVNYDITSQSFVLSETIRSVLSSTKVELARSIINETNRHIQFAKKDSNITSSIVTPGGEAISLNVRAGKSYGKNDVKFYWNYARVYLNKGTVQTIGAGLSIAGIWIGAGVVAQVAASLGVAIPFIQHGIWFDYNYFYGILGGSFGYQ